MVREARSDLLRSKTAASEVNLDPEPFTRFSFKPPELRKREVMFFSGASATSGLGKRVNEIGDAWRKEHMPYEVPIPSDKLDRHKMRQWLNKHVTGIWAYDVIEDEHAIPFDGVRFSDQTEAAAFRIWWC